jgi:recombination protein RecR
VFYLLNTPENYVNQMAKLLVDLKKEIKICRSCFSVSENEICLICEDKKRDKYTICVVERAIDVMALENVGGYKGVYHVLGGVINPLEHVSPDDLKIYQLLERIKELKREDESKTIEIILATNPTMEGEATALYIKKKIESLNFENLKVSRIGSGLPMGADLEYADQATLSRAMEGRRSI